MRLPTQKEIDLYGDLDGRAAARTFHGKSLQQVEELLDENSLKNQEHFLWMGPKAFVFYFTAALSYLKRTKDGDFANCIIGTLEFRVVEETNDYSKIAQAREQMLEFCRFSQKKFSELELPEEIHGDLPPRIEALIQELQSK